MGQVPNNVVEGPSGGAALEELTKMVRDRHIAQTRRDGRGQSHDRRPPFDQRCMWCDTVGHIRIDCTNFVEVLRSNVVYLWTGRVHVSDTRRLLEVNTGCWPVKGLRTNGEGGVGNVYIDRIIIWKEGSDIVVPIRIRTDS